MSICKDYCKQIKIVLTYLFVHKVKLCLMIQRTTLLQAKVNYLSIIKNYIHLLTEVTPNNNALKFKAKELTAALNGVPFLEFNDENMSKNAPLAQSLLKIPFVNTVFYGKDFITIEKHDVVNWDVIKTRAISVITEHLSHKKPLLLKKASINNGALSMQPETDDPALLREVNDILAKYILPSIQEDGGDVTISAVKNGFVYLKLRGACKSCSFSEITLKNGIEKMLLHYIPSIKGIIHEKDDLEQANVDEFKKFDNIEKIN